jgi:hypothetical protein
MTKIHNQILLTSSPIEEKQNDEENLDQIIIHMKHLMIMMIISHQIIINEKHKNEVNQKEMIINKKPQMRMKIIKEKLKN